MFWASTRRAESPAAAIAAPSEVNGTQTATSTSPSGSRGISSATYWCVSEIVLYIFQLPAMYGRRRASCIVERLHARQRLALEQLERRAAARRQPVDPVGQAELHECRAGVAAADHRVAVGVRNRL